MLLIAARTIAFQTKRTCTTLCHPQVLAATRILSSSRYSSDTIHTSRKAYGYQHRAIALFSTTPSSVSSVSSSSSSSTTSAQTAAADSQTPLSIHTDEAWSTENASNNNSNFHSTIDPTKRQHDDDNAITTIDQSSPNTMTQLLYESPLGSTVTRLRAISLFSALVGTVGLPAYLALFRPDLVASQAPLLAFGLAFCSASCGSTAAIHFVFSPYVYSIEPIPIRACSSPRSEQQDYLLKAVSKSLILTRIETVFDPNTEVSPYQGFRPLCNFVITKKGGTPLPLYVHPEHIYNATLRKALQLAAVATAPLLPHNPDEFL
jgi:hypothetical protein